MPLPFELIEPKEPKIPAGEIAQAVVLATRITTDALYIMESIQVENWAGLVAAIIDLITALLELWKKLGGEVR